MSNNVPPFAQTAIVSQTSPNKRPSSSTSGDSAATHDAEAIARLFRHFPGHLWSEPERKTTAWIWGHGYDITRQGHNQDRKWVCRYCIQNSSPSPQAYLKAAVHHGMDHIFKDHGVRAPSGAKSKAPLEKSHDASQQKKIQNQHYQKKGTKMKQQSVIAALGRIDANDPIQQRIANTYIRSFDRQHFQMLLTRYIVNSNKSFSEAEDPDLRSVFEYLNPAVAVQNAHLTRNSVRSRAVLEWEKHAKKVIQVLANAPGLIHISYDGWTAPNKSPLYGVACFFRDQNSRPMKLILGVPEVPQQHTGENIAGEVYKVLEFFGISHKVGYAVLDNAENMDTSMDELEVLLSWEKGQGRKHRGRCFGHILNLSAKALLFGNFVNAIEDEATGASIISEKEWKSWIKRGPVGKCSLLFNLNSANIYSRKATQYRLRHS